MAWSMMGPMIGANLPQMPEPTFAERLKYGISNFFSPENKNANLGLASALLAQSGWHPTAQAPTLGQALGQAFPAYQQGRQQDKLEADEAQLAEFARGMGLEGVPSDIQRGVVSKMLESQFAPEQGQTDFQRKLAAAEAAGIKPGSPEYNQLLGISRASQFARQFIGMDAAGRPVTFDPATNEFSYGEPIKGLRTPSQVSAFDVRREGELGKQVAGAQFSLPEQEFYAGQTQNLIAELKSHPGKENAVGFVAGRVAATTPEGKNFTVRLDQLKGRTFLAAYQMLKGGGQVTEIEGQKAEDAMARLDRAQTIEEFDLALDDFNAAVAEGTRKLREKASIGPDGQPRRPGPVSAPPAAAGGEIKFLGFDP